MSSKHYLEESCAGKKEISIESSLFTDRKLFIEGTINDTLALGFMHEFMYLSKTDKPISIYINSTGGEVNSGLLMLDLIKNSKNEINIYCVGKAYSMAAILLACGKKGHRFILPHSRVMIHEVLSRVVDGTATSIAKISESILETRDMLSSILAESTGHTLEEINKQTSFDNFMNAEESVNFGICDAVVETLI